MDVNPSNLSVTTATVSLATSHQISANTAETTGRVLVLSDSETIPNASSRPATPSTSTSSSMSESTPLAPTIASITKKGKTDRQGRLQSKSWFLTFPQTDTSKEVVLERIKSHKELSKLLKGVMIAQETHQDGQKHLHIGLWLKKPLRTANRRYFDFACLKHGNYTIMKSGYGAVNYLRWV